MLTSVLMVNESKRGRVMHVATAGDDLVYGGGRELAVVAICGENFCPAREELGRAAFIGFDMGQTVADHRAVGITTRGNCQASWPRCQSR